MFRNLDCRALGISGLSSEVIESLLSNRFQSVELDIVEFASQAETHGLAKARRLIDSARLKFGCFTAPIELGAEQEEFKLQAERLGAYADLAQQLGCTRGVVNIEPASDIRPYHENFEFHRRRIAEVSAQLKTFNIRLGVGILAPTRLRKDRAYQFIQAFDQLLLLLRMTDAPNTGLWLDVWHWRLGGGTLEQLRALPGQPVVSLVLSDSDPGITAESAYDTARCLPGDTGVIDAAAALKFLAERGYDGPVTPLAHPSRFPAPGRDKMIQAAGAALDRAWAAADLPSAGKKTPALAGK